MLLKQYYLGCLSHASYLLGDEASGTAIVVDPQRDVQQYLDDAEAAGLRIERVVLTHFHADFIAGHLELEAATGATIHMGWRAEAEYGVEALHDGDVWSFPSMRIEFLESPGHTPEMVNLVVYDLERDPHHPYAVLTGDTLFNGDVGRPDLLASRGHTEHELANMLFDSIQKLKGLPDDTLVYPAHGAGSMCGRNLSEELVTTMGAQRIGNYAMRIEDRAAFVEAVTTDQPPAPAYFAYNADLNRRRRDTLDTTMAALTPLDLDTVLAHVTEGHQVVDTRDDDAFAGAHLPGTVNIGLDGTYATWCGSVLDPKRPIAIIADPGREEESAIRLGRVGYDKVAGFLAGGFDTLNERRPDLLASASRVAPKDFGAAARGATVLDVRSTGERDALWIPGSVHVPLGELGQRLHEVPVERPVLVHCAGGYRSSLAASLLRRHGYGDVRDLRGGITAVVDRDDVAVRKRQDGIEQVSPVEVPALLDQGAVLVDVREDHEWAEGHIPGALHRPMSRFDAWRDEFPPDETLVLQCRSGNRSQTLARALAQRGHRRAVNLAGGILAWPHEVVA